MYCLCNASKLFMGKGVDHRFDRTCNFKTIFLSCHTKMGRDKVMHHISKKMIMFHHVILQILRPKQQNTAICNIIYQFIINQLRMYNK